MNYNKHKTKNSHPFSLEYSFIFEEEARQFIYIKFTLTHVMLQNLAAQWQTEKNIFFSTCVFGKTLQLWRLVALVWGQGLCCDKVQETLSGCSWVEGLFLFDSPAIFRQILLLPAISRCLQVLATFYVSSKRLRDERELHSPHNFRSVNY